MAKAQFISAFSATKAQFIKSFVIASIPTLLPIMMNMNQFNGGIYETD